MSEREGSFQVDCHHEGRRTRRGAKKHQGEAPLPLSELVSSGLVEYIPFPEALVGKYQCFTQADLTRLRATGCDHVFADVATGVGRYVNWLAAQG